MSNVRYVSGKRIVIAVALSFPCNHIADVDSYLMVVCLSYQATQLNFYGFRMY